MPLGDELAKSKKRPVMELLHRLEHAERQMQPLFIDPVPAMEVARCREWCAHERDLAWWALHGCPFLDCTKVCRRQSDFKKHLETHAAWSQVPVPLQLKLIAGNEYELDRVQVGLLRTYDEWLESYPNIVNAREQDKQKKAANKRSSDDIG